MTLQCRLKLHLDIEDITILFGSETFRQSVTIAIIHRQWKACAMFGWIAHTSVLRYLAIVRLNAFIAIALMR